MPEFGYQEYYLAKHHAEMGNEVHVICSNRTYPKQREYNVFSDVYKKRIVKPEVFNFEGFTVHRLPGIFEVNMQIILKGLFRKLNEIKPDVIFVHGLNRWTTFFVAFWKLLFNNDLTLIVDDHMLFSAYIPKWYRKFGYLIYKSLIKF
jgi:hypothetical protein